MKPYPYNVKYANVCFLSYIVTLNFILSRFDFRKIYKDKVCFSWEIVITE